MTNLVTDEELYSRFLDNRDEDALLVLITRHKESLMLFINGFVHDIDRAEELALDTFSEVAAGPTLFSGGSSFKTWLFAIGRNLTLKTINKSKRLFARSIEEINEFSDLESTDQLGQMDSPEMELLKDEENRKLYEAMSLLNPEYRRILVLLYFEDMTREEAASVMGKNKKQVYNLAERARKALKEILVKTGFEYDIH